MIRSFSQPQAPPRRSSARRFVFRMLTMGVTVIVLLGLVEASLWIFAPIRFHEWMAWIPDGRIRARAQPNQVFFTSAGDMVRINRFGFRGSDWALSPAPGTLRLLAFGGSSTFCYDVHGEGATWPARLQATLATELKMPVEVLNLGLPGFDATNSKVNYMFFGRALHPHAAIFYHTWNDMKQFRLLPTDPRVFIDWVPGNPWWQRIARATQLGRYARNAYWNHYKRRLETRYTTLAEQGGKAAQPVDPVAFDWARKNYEDFVDLAHSDNVLPVLAAEASLIHPKNFEKPGYRHEMDVDAVGMTLPVAYQSWMEMRKLIQDVAEKHDAIFIDAYDPVPHDFEHLEDEVHLTDKGCDLLAHVIARRLTADQRFMNVVRRVRAPSASATSLPDDSH